MRLAAPLSRGALLVVILSRMTLHPCESTCGTRLAIGDGSMSLTAARFVALTIPCALALTAYLNANAINALVGADLAMVAAPTVEVGPAPSAPIERPSANAILARNAFDHMTGPIGVSGVDGSDVAKVRTDDPRTAPPCANVRALAAVRAGSAEYSFAALEAGGKRVLRRRGDPIDEASVMKVAFVGEDRVWLDDGTALCQARVGATVAASPPPKDAPRSGALESKLTGKIVKSGPNEWTVDRGAVDLLLEAQAELMKSPLVPVKEGDRIVGMRIPKVRSGALAMLGIEDGDRLDAINGFELTSPEKMLEVYARLKSGTADRISIHVVRKGKPTNLDYTIR